MNEVYVLIVRCSLNTVYNSTLSLYSNSSLIMTLYFLIARTSFGCDKQHNMCHTQN